MGEPALAQEPAGAYVPEPGKVAIRDVDGTVSKIPLADFHAAQAEGARPATQAEYFGAKHGAAGQVTAGLVGAARGASFGLSDPLYVEGARLLGGDQDAEGVRNTINLLREAHPDATLGGEVAGAVAPAFFGGGGAAAGAISGESALARAGARVLQAAPRAVGEGVAMGLGQQYSEDTLQNKKLVGENYVSAGFKGGMIGLLLGGAAHAGFGAAADKTAQLFGRPITEASERAAIREEGTAYRTAEHAGEPVEAAGVKGPFASRLETEADVRRFQGATNAKVTDIRRLGTEAGEQRARAAELGEMLGRETTAEGKPLVGPLVTQAESAKRIAMKLDEVGASLRPLYRELDTAAARPSTSTIASRFADEVAGPALKMPLGEAEVSKAQKYLNGLVKKSGESPTFEDLWDVRRNIDQLLKGDYAKVPGATAPRTGAEALRGLRGIIDDELLKSADKASAELGTGIGDKLRLTNALYRDLATVNKIAQHQAANGASRNTISITDAIAAAHGGPAGLVMTGANMVRRHLGDQLAAHVLDKVSKMQAVQNAATRMDNLLSQGTKAFLSGEKVAARPMKLATAQEIRDLRTIVSSPSAVTARIHEALADLPTHAPGIAQAASSTVGRGAAWLMHVLPKETPPIGPFAKPQPAVVSDSDRLKATAAIETVADGSVVVDRLREGRLTDMHVATLKYVHPETYDTIRRYLAAHQAELGKTMNQQQLTRLGILFGEPLTEQDLPENRRAFQASFSQGNQAPGPGGSGGGIRSAAPVPTGVGNSTSFDRLEAGK